MLLELWRRLRGRGRAATHPSALDGVDLDGGSALDAAVVLGDLAGRVGFDWDEPLEALEKVREEVEEIEEVLREGADPARVADEIGDLIFSSCMVARKAGVDPDAALRATMRKFRARFVYIERELDVLGITPQQASLEQMEALWQDSKRALAER